MRARGLRVDYMDAHSHMNKRIKHSQHDQVPFMLIAGEREREDGTVAVRRRGTREQEVLPFERVLESLVRLRDTRSVEMDL